MHIRRGARGAITVRTKFRNSRDLQKLRVLSEFGDTFCEHLRR